MHTILTLLLLASTADAYSTGITGKSVTGCTNCHGASAARTTTARLTATSTTLAVGRSTNVNLRVSTTDATRTYAGLNAAATGGTLSAGINTVLSGTEITHSAPQILTAGTITFRFRWTAPATPGTYSITAAGNAVNFNGASSGDGWNIARPLTMTVTAAFTGDDAEAMDEEVEVAEDAEDVDTLPELSPEMVDELAAWADGAEAEDLEVAEADEASGDEVAVDLSGCSTTGGSASAGVVGLGALAALAARRRRRA